MCAFVHMPSYGPIPICLLWEGRRFQMFYLTKKELRSEPESVRTVRPSLTRGKRMEKQERDILRENLDVNTGHVAGPLSLLV